MLLLVNMFNSAGGTSLREPPVLLIQYELSHRAGQPLPFSPWFSRDAGLRVFAANVRFSGDKGIADYVGITTPNGSLVEFCATPSTNCHEWRVVRLEKTSAVIAASWAEPIYPGVNSPMRVAVRALGRGTQCGVEITSQRVIHRILCSSRGAPESLWPMLVAEMRRYAGLEHVDVACELTYLGPATVEHKRLTRSRHARVVELLGAKRPGDPSFAASAALLQTSEEELARRVPRGKA